MKQKGFTIPFSGLKQGKHEFKYEIDNTFFESFGYEEFNDAKINLGVSLNKLTTMMELSFEGSGVVNVNCDLTSEPYNQEISSTLELIVKFGEDYNDEDDEILILPHGEHQVDISQYAYEMLVLAVPHKRIHPGVEDGTLDSDVLQKLNELQPKETRQNKEESDPRWDELKKLLTDK